MNEEHTQNTPCGHGEHGLRDQEPGAPAPRARAQPGWLWISAGVLAALIVVQGGGFFESPARAEMATTGGNYALMTTDGGNDEILVVVDSRQESLMVYRTYANNQLKLMEREELSSLFTRARARAMGSP